MEVCVKSIGPNRDMANRPYAEKRLALKKSKLRLTCELAEENEEWTPERLLEHQRKLAKLATGFWRIAQLS